MTNSETGQRAAVAADALTEYDHLPLVAIHVHPGGVVHLTPDSTMGAYTTTTDRITVIGRWAAAHGVPVAMDTSSLCPTVRAVVLLRDIPAEIYATLTSQEVYELAVRLGVQPKRGGSVEVTGEQLLAAVHVDQVEAVPAEAVPAVAL